MMHRWYGIGLAIVCLVLIVLLGMTLQRLERASNSAASDREQSTGADRDHVTAPKTAPASWPVFRGNPELTGVAPAGSVPDNLRLRWVAMTGAAVTSSPVVGRGRVFVGSQDGAVYAFDLVSGAQVWRCDTGAAIEAPPLLAGDAVVIGNSDGILYALEAGTGQELWQYHTGDRILGAANTASSAAGQQTVVVGSYDSHLHCVELATGKPLWTLESENYINGAPAVTGAGIVFGGCDGMIRIAAAADGVELGHVPVGSYIPGSVCVRDGTAYIGHYDGEVVAVDLANQQVLWRYSRTQNPAPFFSSPAAAAAALVIGSRDALITCLDPAQGRLLWTFRARDAVDSSPVICGDRVVCGSDDGRLYVLALTDGSLVWSYEIGAAIGSSPAVTAGMVVVGAADGGVYAFGE